MKGARGCLEHMLLSIRRNHILWRDDPALMFQQLYPDLWWAPDAVRPAFQTLCRSYLPRYSRRGPWVRRLNPPPPPGSLDLRVAAEDGAGIGVLRFLPGDRRLAAGTDRGRALIWDLDSGASRAVALSANPIIALGPLPGPPCGFTAVSSSGRIVRVDADRLESETLVGGSGPALSADISSDGRYAALGTAFGAVEIWDLSIPIRTGKFLGRRVPIVRLVFSGDGSELLGINALGQATIWSVGSDTPRAAFSLDPGSLLFAGSPEPSWWTGGKGRPFGRIRADRTAVEAVAGIPDRPYTKGAASPCGRIIVLGGDDGSITVVSDPGDHPRVTTVRLAQAPLSLAVSSDLESLAAAGPDGACEIHARSRMAAAEDSVPAKTATGPKYLPSLNSIIWATEDGRLHQFDARADRGVEPLAARKGLSGPTAASAQGTIWAAAEGGESHAWDLLRRVPLGRIGTNETCVALALSPDGLSAASGWDNGHAVFWHTPSGGEYGRAGLHAGAIRAMVFSPRGDELASVGADRRIRIFRIEETESDGARGEPVVFVSPNRTPLKRWRPALRWETAVASAPSALAWSSADPKIACAVTGGIEFFLPPSTEAVNRLRRGAADCVSLEFSSDGRHLLAVEADGACRIWDLTTGREIGRFRMGTAALGGSWSFGDLRFAAASADGDLLRLALENDVENDKNRIKETNHVGRLGTVK